MGNPVTEQDQKLRIALGKTTKEERAEILGDDEELKTRFLKVWNKGKVCARCEHFSSLGSPNSGLNGTCSSLTKSDYTRPEESCGQFQLDSTFIND